MLSPNAASPAGLLFPWSAASATRRPMDRPLRDEPARAARDELSRLLEKVAARDHGAFSAVYERTSAKLYGILLRLLGSPEEAQDVLQDAYVTVWNNASRFDRSKASPITWLATVARNKAIDRLRRTRAATDDLDAAADIADEGPTAFEVVASADDEQRLRHCLDELDDRARTMIRAAFLDGASYPQLANREGVPLPTMKSWIRRGLQRLRGCLEQ